MNFQTSPPVGPFSFPAATPTPLWQNVFGAQESDTRMDWQPAQTQIPVTNFPTWAPAFQNMAQNPQNSVPLTQEQWQYLYLQNQHNLQLAQLAAQAQWAQSQGLLIQGFQGQQTPDSLVFAPPRGEASPEAIAYLNSIGLDYNGRVLNAAAQAQVQVKPIAHPASIFQPTKELLEDRSKDPKYVLVDVEALAKILRKSSSAEVLGTSTGVRSYRTRNWIPEPQRWNPAVGSRSDTSLSNGRRTYSSADARFSWERNSDSSCRFTHEVPPCRPSLFDSKTPIGSAWSYHGQSLPYNDLSASADRTPATEHFSGFKTSTPGKRGPPRNNNGTGTASDLFGSYHDRYFAASNQRQPQVVGNLPYRFPSRNTLSLYPNPRTPRPRSSDARIPSRSNQIGREDCDIYWRMSNVGPRNLSCNEDIYQEGVHTSGPARAEGGIFNKMAQFLRLGQAARTPEPVKRTPSGNFDAGVILTRVDYFCEPHWRQLNRMTTATGQCYVTKFIVGHLIWGEIIYEGAFDVSGLNLDMLVEFEQSTVRVYPPNCGYQIPPVGQGLNRPATVILRRVFPTNPITKRAVTDPGKIRHLNFAEHLRKKSESYSGTFVSYEAEGGVWTFKVPYMVPNTIRPYYTTLA